MKGAEASDMVTGAMPAAPVSGPPHRTVSWPWLLMAFAAAMWPLAATPVLPLIDLYNHIARLTVLSGITDNPLFDANYSADWSPLPNIGLDVIGMGLDVLMVPPALVPHLVAVLIVGLLFAGILALSRAVTGQLTAPTVLLALPLLYNWVFNWGFANFLLGLGLALLAAVWWLTQRHRPIRRIGVALVLALAIYFCHALAFGLYGILIASLELGHWWQQPGRRAGDLATRMGWCAVQALLPAILFLQSRTAANSNGITNADESLARLRAAGQLLARLQQLAVMRVETIVRVAEGPSYLADALWMAALIGVLFAAFRRRALALSPLVLPSALSGLALVLLMPPALFGSGYVADRMPLFLALVLLCGLQPGPGRAAWLLPALAGLAGLRLLLIVWQWHGTAADLADFDVVAARLPPAQIVPGIAVGARPHEDMPNRCEMYPPLLLVRHGHATPLFEFRFAQPLTHRGELAALRNARSAQKLSMADQNNPALLVADHARAGYKWLLLCQVDAARPLPDTPYPIVAQAGRFRLLRLSGER